jgi:hypothetical protein
MCFDQVDLVAGLDQVQRRLYTSDPPADDHDRANGIILPNSLLHFRLSPHIGKLVDW